MIVGTNRDVKWICKTLAEMKGSIEDHKGRIRKLEEYRAESGGREGRLQRVSVQVQTQAKQLQLYLKC